MSQKVEKPSLSGQRIKTRKRDEKEKYDPVSFRDAILQGFNEAGTGLDQITKYLDVAGGRLDYRRYADVLFDVLFAGGILAPGGSISTEGSTPGTDGVPAKPISTDTCVFKAEDEYGALYAHYEVFFKLIRRYKYLEKSFQDELKKLIVFLKGFRPDARVKLAKIYGIFFANGLGDAACLQGLFEEHLVKEGIAIDFATVLFTQWLALKDINHIAGALKRASMEAKLMNLLPFNKRTQENFRNHFEAAGLDSIVDFQRSKATVETKRELSKHLSEMIDDEKPVREIITFVQDNIKKFGIPEHEVIVIMWVCVMNSVEWNKKDELVAEQAMKHLRNYSPMFASMSESGRSQLALIVKVQDYCYDNMSFMKAFSKIVQLFYKNDILSEGAILKWYKDSHSSKGKSVFLAQMKTFVEWLQNAEEESDEEGEDED